MALRPFVSAFAVMLAAQSASAFGTIHGLGQNAEHERITRHALGCVEPSGMACFQPFSLDQLAGKKGTFGAVGAPDNPTRGLMSTDAAHCDNGDFLDVPGYPHSRDEAAVKLYGCRAWIARNIESAAEDAGALLTNGRIDGSQIPTAIACAFNGKKGRAKCNVLEDFGLALHASQDFYSHSNWADEPAAGPVAVSNPPGLGQAIAAPFLNLRTDGAIPEGLMTGCYVQKNATDFDGTGGCPGRVTHFFLNKDTGTIDPVLGAGTTPRGKIDHNFARAVTAAIADTQDKWAFLRDRLLARYGTTDGNLMICALTHDDPERDC